MKVYVSGLYSGPSPSPGIGVARSIRAAYPEAKIIGVDYWYGSPGIHFEEFDDVWVQPSIADLDRETYAKQIKALLAEGAFWISTLDLELRWLADSIGAHPRLLSLQQNLSDLLAKPEVMAAAVLNLERPRYIKIKDKTDEEIYSFCRKNSWRVWLKSPFYEAISVKNWNEFEAARKLMEHKWKTLDLFLQAHVSGQEESICFSAYQGELLSSLYMKKKITTPDGKTWAGQIQDLNYEIEDALRVAIGKINYTGGGELELIVDSDEKLFLIEWNPRFPAWIHGATLSGRNLVATLLEKASGMRAQECSSFGSEFTRVVLEVPVKKEYALPLVAEVPAQLRGVSGKYGQVFDSLLESFSKKDSEEKSVLENESEINNIEIEDLDLYSSEAFTPCRFFLPQTAKRNFLSLSQRLSQVASEKLRITPAYSIKTSPDEEYLELAKKYSFKAECISQLEVKRALEFGFSAENIILNGPGKWWPSNVVRSKEKYKAVFCDSIEELSRVVDELPSVVIGVRLKIPSIHSRFGISISQPNEFKQLCNLIKKIPHSSKLGIHFHMASSAIGVGVWLDAFEALLQWVRSIELVTQKKVSVLDLGGGWVLEDLLGLSFKQIVDHLEDHFPYLEELIYEPGKALTQSSMALATKVLDVRRKGKRVDEIVVDACIAEMPIASIYPHSFLWRADNKSSWKKLKRGQAKVLGRICMEDDVLSKGLLIPENIKIGDELILLEAGAYERSMSYGFGRGGYA